MPVMKRSEVPGFWPIEKKTKKFTVAPRPGPHSQRSSLTLAVIIRDVLKHAETLREVREILNSGTVRVDGMVRKTTGFPVGLMDMISIGEENYRLLPGKHGLYLREAGKELFKLKKIVNKTTVGKGRTQINFHDGSNILADGTYRTGDVVIFDLDNKKIKDVIKQEKGSMVLVIKGNNTGTLGTLEKINVVKSSEPNIAEVAAGEKKITLPLDYVFTVGKTEPVVAISEEDGNE